MKQQNPWHPADRVAKVLKLDNDLGDGVRVTDKLTSESRNPFVGIGVVGFNGALYVAIGGVAPYVPKKGEKAGQSLLAWGYNAKAFVRIHGHEPTSALSDIARLRAGLDAITEADIQAAIVAATADSAAPRSKGVGSLADLMG